MDHQGPCCTRWCTTRTCRYPLYQTTTGETAWHRAVTSSTLHSQRMLCSQASCKARCMPTLLEVYLSVEHLLTWWVYCCRFPMPKDHLLYLALQQAGLAVAPQQQQQQPALPPPPAAAAVRSNVFIPTYPDADTLCLAHDRTYVDSFLSGSISAAEMRRIGLPWSEQLVQRTLVGTGSAVLAARLALQFGVAIMCNGGTHHAHRAHGSGAWFEIGAVAAAQPTGVG